jgi:hypothetical protein
MFALFLVSTPLVFHDIVVFAIAGSPMGFPTELRSLLLTCRAFRDALSSASSSFLYRRILGVKFDDGALVRRLGYLDQRSIEFELQRRFSTFQCFRSGDVYHHAVPEAFLVAYLMALEDQGKNMVLLGWAGLPSFLCAFLRARLLEGSEHNHNWPLQNEINSLAIALFWLTASSCAPFPLGGSMISCRIAAL